MTAFVPVKRMPCARPLTSLIMGLALFGAPDLALAQDGSMAAAKADGTQLIMRHAIAPGTGDPANFQLGDCSTQRNLSDEGRQQARAIGAKLKDAGVKIDLVLTSQWCRARETAELMDVGPVEDAPFLNSFFGDRGTAGSQKEAALERLRELTANGKKALLVTHQVNITGLTGIYPSSGEIVLIEVGEGDNVEIFGRLAG